MFPSSEYHTAVEALRWRLEMLGDAWTKEVIRSSRSRFLADLHNQLTN